jgi:predicted transcriptional regulator
MRRREEKRNRFLRDALGAWADYQATGLHGTAEEADVWLAKLKAGEKVALPSLRRSVDYGREPHES